MLQFRSPKPVPRTCYLRCRHRTSYLPLTIGGGTRKRFRAHMLRISRRRAERAEGDCLAFRVMPRKSGCSRFRRGRSRFLEDLLPSVSASDKQPTANHWRRNKKTFSRGPCFGYRGEGRSVRKEIALPSVSCRGSLVIRFAGAEAGPKDLRPSVSASDKRPTALTIGGGTRKSFRAHVFQIDGLCPQRSHSWYSS